MAESTPDDYEPHSTYQPYIVLGDGVAVLVDYQQNPDIGRELSQQETVGLAVYLQQPYLLVFYTTADSSAAAAKIAAACRAWFDFVSSEWSDQVIRLTDTIQ